MIFTREEKLAIIFILSCALLGTCYLSFKAYRKSSSQLTVRDAHSVKEECININTASIKELMSLKRIGPVLGERIVLYREANGPFKSAGEIKNVKGIGEHTYDLIKDRIRVE